LPHLPRDFVALRSCLQIPQLLTLADVRFLGRIPLQPWVEETTESTVEDRNSRRAICAAQAAPTHRANSFTPSH
jgi:hypothetical protein